MQNEQAVSEDELEAFEYWAALAGVDTNAVGAWEQFEQVREYAEGK